MNRQVGSRFGTTYQPTSRPTIIDRSMPPISTGRTAQLIKTINSGGMNISSTNNTRVQRVGRTSHTSPERYLRHNTTLASRRLPSRDRSYVATNGTTSTNTERYVSSNPTVTLYTIEAFPLSNNGIEPETIKTKLPALDRRISQTSVPIPHTESKLTHGGLCGLQNLGNTCFMNSVLQCLSNTEPLLSYCLQIDLEHDLNTSVTSVMKGALMKEYTNLMRKMWLMPEGRSIVSPVLFKNTIGKFAPRFLGYSEQDAQEFLRCLLQGLSEDVNRVQKKPVPNPINEKEEERMKEKDRAKLSWERCLSYENSPLVDIFTGQLKSTLECSYCNYQSTTFDMFWDLSLPLPRDRSTTNLQECIQLFMSKEELNGNEEPMCAKCKQKRPCTKKLSLQKCPKILVLHLKRFSQMFGRTKLNTHVDFPLTNLKLNDLPDVMSNTYQGPVPTYNLFGVSNHTGSIYTGHYTAQCKHPYTQQWHEFNDTSVYMISDISKIISSDAYLLFYEQNRS